MSTFNGIGAPDYSAIGSGTQNGTTGGTANVIPKATSANILADSSFAESVTGILTGGFLQNTSGDVLQTADVTKNNNTTVADLTGLSVNLTTGRKYRFKAVLFVDSSAVGDGLAGIKVTFAGTATGSQVIIGIEFQGAVVSTNVSVTSISGTATSAAITLTDAVNVVNITGTILCNGTGTFKIQGAQASAVAQNTVFKAGSYMSAVDVA